ncbi:Retinol dehydrogenase 12, partial [Pseudolycoriella hygida]
LTSLRRLEHTGFEFHWEMSVLQKLIQLKTFLSLVTSTSIKFLIYKYFVRKNIRRNEEDIRGKCVVVTGGSSGIGKSSAKEFAQRGATVVIGDVDFENGQKVVQEIQKLTGNANVEILKLDLSDMDSVEQFARTVSAKHPKIKILCNNAGIGGSKDENIKTKDGFNIHVAVNYMGHFLLTNLLKKNLEAELQPRQEFHLGRRSRIIHSYAFCPGMVNTPITTSKDVGPGLKFFYRISMNVLATTPDEAASEFLMFCALEKSIEGETGKIYQFRKHFSEAIQKLDSQLAEDLWEKSSELNNLSKMRFMQKISQMKRFVVVVTSAWYAFFVYKHFKRNNYHRNEEDINGKCVVVTGGSSGIGRSSAREFAQRGATVVIGDIDMENGEKVVQEIKKESGNMNVTIFKLDLSDMDSVEHFAHQVSTLHPKIKILLNNAGIGGSKDENIKTKDGFNIHIAVNYMGHFLLTNLLMKNLKAEIHPRIVITTSSYLLMSELDLDDINMDKSGFGFENCLPYCNTKFCLALFTRELGRRTGINAYALCPGMVDTPINNLDNIGTGLKFFYRMALSTCSSTANEAASEFVMYCALDKGIEHETGQIYRFRKHFDKANERLDSELAKSLWEKSSEMVRLSERMSRVK